MCVYTQSCYPWKGISSLFCPCTLWIIEYCKPYISGCVTTVNLIIYNPLVNSYSLYPGKTIISLQMFMRFVDHWIKSVYNDAYSKLIKWI